MNHNIEWPVPGPFAVTNTPQANPIAAAPLVFNTDENPIDPNEPAKFRRFGPMTQDEALMRHSQLQKQLVALKDDELELRTAVAKILLRSPGHIVKEGVNNIDLGEGYTAKVGNKFNYTVKSSDPKKDKLDAVDDVVDAMGAIGNEGSFIAERIFKWSVDISLTEYRKLVDEAETSAEKKKLLLLVNTVLEIKEATPTLEIKEPKGKK